ncbi:MAG: serine/threonine-protein kinase [Deltaproteobacteria bacterium]
MPSDRELAEAVQSVELGEIIGDYRLEKLLGAGATSRVFLGVHTRLGRRAAVKVLSPQLVDEPAVIERLLREARVVNDIRHPNIVDVSDFIDTPSPRRVALIMEYVEGPSLKALRGSPIEFGQAIGITLQLVAAVQAAHNAGVIHRDIKPDNLLLLLDPRRVPGAIPGLKVVDFGLAKVVQPIGKNAATGVMLGTPAYMAPEQIAGRPAPSPATDVYAIAEVLYELLSSARLFPPGNISDIVRTKLRGPLPSMNLPSKLPGGGRLVDLILACLAVKPEERPDLTEVKHTLIDVCPEHVLAIGSGTWGHSKPVVPSDDEPAEEGTDVTTQPGVAHPQDFLETIGQNEPPIAPAATDVEPPPPDAMPTRVAPSDSAARALASPVALDEDTSDAQKTATYVPLDGPTKPPEPPAPRPFAETDPTPPGPTPMPLQAPTRRSRAPLWAALAALAAALAVGVVVLRRDTSNAQVEEPNVVPSVKAASQVFVRLSSEPSGAAVRDEVGLILGRTPLEVPVRPNTSRRVEVAAPGFETRVVTISSADGARQVDLQPRSDTETPSRKRRSKKSDAKSNDPKNGDEAFPSW